MGAKKRWLFTLFLATFVSILLFISSICGFNGFNTHKPFTPIIRRGPGYPPAFAYYIYGNAGDGDSLFRLLLAVYHPRNRYLLHIGTEGSDDERLRLSERVRGVAAIRAFGNVDVMGKPDPMTYMGSSNIAAVLHAGAILLKLGGDWDWFITLSALDYPLLTQDDLFHAFFLVSRDLNFIDHTSDLGFKEEQRVLPIVVDPGLYLARRTQIFHATEKRPMPDAFKVFTGSPWVILSRNFLEYCIFGWDNLPRTLLMYANNVVLPQEVYFHTVICNSPEFMNTTVNNDLRYVAWDDPPKMEPLFLNISDYMQMVQSGAAFARQFKKNDAVLDMVDRRILKRGRSHASPGAWCTGRDNWFSDPCSQWGDINVLRPGSRAKNLESSLNSLLEESNLLSNQCK